MNTLTSIFLFVVLNPFFAQGDSTYEKAMKDAVEKMNQAASIEDFQEVANLFDRIGNVEKDHWLPFYHAAYTRVMMAAMEQDLQKKDPYLDAAQQDLDAVEKMDHDEIERLALQGFLYMIRMSVDPSRGMELGQQCAMLLNRAYAMDNQNPRAVLMLGQFNHGSAQYLGQDTSEACAMFDQAVQLFERSEDDYTGTFLPDWGRNLALMMQQQCRK